MKILLQKTKTGLYLQNSGLWTRDINDAFDFGTSQSAIEHAVARKILEAHVVAAFPDGPHMECVRYPIDPPRKTRAVRATSSM